MGRWCFCSPVSPGKADLIRNQWKEKVSPPQDVMTGFEIWLQPTSHGDFIIHCVEGESLAQIIELLRGQYYLPEVEPHIERLLNISLPTNSKSVKRSFLYPLLPGKEEQYRRFTARAMGEKKGLHETMMRAFGVSQLTIWVQTTPNGCYIIVYSERHINTPTTPQSRLEQGKGSDAWHEIATSLITYTGLTLHELSPDVEWLTEPE